MKFEKMDVLNVSRAGVTLYLLIIIQSHVNIKSTITLNDNNVLLISLKSIRNFGSLIVLFNENHFTWALDKQY